MPELATDTLIALVADAIRSCNSHLRFATLPNTSQETREKELSEAAHALRRAAAVLDSLQA